MSQAEPAARQHASTGPASPQLPEPTHAERVRTLMSLVPIATLSTLSRKHPGFPFGSLMPFALDSAGRPIFLISNMAMHTQNLKADSRCSLFVAQVSADGDPLGAARATLVGNAGPVPENDIATVREAYLARHENSRYWVDFSDFSFFRLQPIDLYYVGGFGVMGWVDARDYAHAAPDPLAEAAPGILALAHYSSLVSLPELVSSFALICQLAAERRCKGSLVKLELVQDTAHKSIFEAVHSLGAQVDSRRMNSVSYS